MVENKAQQQASTAIHSWRSYLKEKTKIIIEKLAKPIWQGRFSELSENVLKYRLPSLLIGGLIGILIAIGVYYLACLDMNNIQLQTTLTVISLGIPIYLLLWHFRTHDTREMIHQSDLFDALDKLTDEKVVAREIAVDRLIRLSKKVSAYNKTIKLAFIKLIKHFPPTEAEKNSEIKRTYAQHILTWLSKNYEPEEELDLNDCDFSWQFFSKDTDFSCLAGEKRHGISFVYADLSHCDLTEANLTEVNLTHANLTKANLTRAYLFGTNLTNVNLTGANLSYANLTNANLTDADFTNTNLSYANLTEATLTKANLTDANLTDADFTDATIDNVIWHNSFYYKSLPPKGLPTNIMERIQVKELPKK